ncbi:MAG TPA: SURF1 family protein [Acidimicrobiia bacterium]
MRTLLRPRWLVAHVVAIVFVIAFVMLAFWQIRRLEDRRDFNHSVEQALATDPVDIGDAPAEGYVRVIATGVYDPSMETLTLRSLEGTSGYHVLTPLVLADGTGVLVDRGWVPISYDTPPVGGPAAASTGEVRVTGILWPSEHQGIPDALPGTLRAIDPAVVDAFTPYPMRSTYLVLQAADPALGELPVPPEPPELSDGPHLGYAVQWFLFAGVVIVGYPILLRRVARTKKIW